MARIAIRGDDYFYRGRNAQQGTPEHALYLEKLKLLVELRRINDRVPHPSFLEVQRAVRKIELEPPFSGRVKIEAPHLFVRRTDRLEPDYIGTIVGESPTGPRLGKQARRIHPMHPSVQGKDPQGK